MNNTTPHLPGFYLPRRPAPRERAPAPQAVSWRERRAATAAWAADPNTKELLKIMKKPTKTKNPAAVALGRLAAGHPKNYSTQERERRAALMRQIAEIARNNNKKAKEGKP